MKKFSSLLTALSLVMCSPAIAEHGVDSRFPQPYDTMVSTDCTEVNAKGIMSCTIEAHSSFCVDVSETPPRDFAALFEMEIYYLNMISPDTQAIAITNMNTKNPGEGVNLVFTVNTYTYEACLFGVGTFVGEPS